MRGSLIYGKFASVWANKVKLRMGLVPIMSSLVACGNL
jgi:hypothetical protein